MKSYPLDVKRLSEYEGLEIGYWSKGFHAEEDFIYATLARFGPESVKRLNCTTYTQHWWRCVPTGEKGQHTLENAVPNSSGAFPVSVVEVR
jgi:hypothetical protein